MVNSEDSGMQHFIKWGPYLYLSGVRLMDIAACDFPGGRGGRGKYDQEIPQSHTEDQAIAL